MCAKKLFYLSFSVFFTIFLASGFAEESNGFKPRISLKLTGGGSYFAIGDINDSLLSIDRVLASGAYRAYSTDNIIKLNNWISTREAEVRFDITARFSLGIAVSNAFHLNKESTVPLFSYPGSPSIGSFSSTPDVQMRVPIKFSVYYSLPLRLRLSILISVGVGYYSGKMAESLDYEISDEMGPAWYISEWETEWKSSFGFHGGLGAEYHLSKRLSLVIEAQYRIAKIRNFEATMSADSNLWDHIRNYDPEGILYLWGWGEDGPMGLGYRELIVWSGTPPSYKVMFGGAALRKAILDLSGMSLRLGISVKLF